MPRTTTVDMPIGSGLRSAVAGLAVAALLLSACSKSAGSSAERYINDTLEEEIGLGSLDAACTQPAAYQEGELFSCTATADDDRVITFEGKMADEETFSLYSTNLLVASDVVAIREAAAESLGPEVGATISPDDIKCSEVVVLDGAGDFTCEITRVLTGEVYELVVSTGGIERGVGVRELNFRITEQLR